MWYRYVVCCGMRYVVYCMLYVVPVCGMRANCGGCAIFFIRPFNVRSRVPKHYFLKRVLMQW